LTLKLLVMVLFASAFPSYFVEEAAADDCAQTNATPLQPTRADAQASIIKASLNQLSASYPKLPLTSMVPCLLPQSMSWIESAWKQATGATAMGSRGPVLTSKSGCGYGMMQITSGMMFAGQIDRNTQLGIAGDFVYNVAYGLKMLGDKWNFTPAIGSNDPSVLEDWYYALWAYNQWTWRNNPNNPDFPNARPVYNGTQPVTNYPYQELVLGLVANPPKSSGQPLWSASAVSFPNKGEIGTNPDVIQDPSPIHRITCSAQTANQQLYFPGPWIFRTLG
jgi:hypothetical protein